jgi:hypothetical protein
MSYGFTPLVFCVSCKYLVFGVFLAGGSFVEPTHKLPPDSQWDVHVSSRHNGAAQPLNF